MRARSAVAVLACSFLSQSIDLRAQDFTRTEVGITNSILFSNRLEKVTDAGLGGRFTWNLSPNLALEAEADGYFTGSDLTRDMLTSGSLASVFAGPKAGIRRRNFGVFFKSQIGVLSYSDVITSTGVRGSLATSRRTHAAMDMGGVVEFYPSRRLVLRADIGEVLARYGDSTQITFPSGGELRTEGLVPAMTHFTFSASYRMGQVRTDPETSSVPSPLQFGIQYSLQTLQREILVTRDESAVGGWLTYNLGRHFGLDAAANYFPRKDHLVGFQQGGKMIQAFAGVRWGVRRDHWGIFAKFRPGAQIYTLTEGFDFRQFFDPRQPLPTSTVLAFDAGGIFEIYTSRHTMLRFDAGDTRILFHDRHFLDFTGAPFTVPGGNRPSIQLTGGFGFRF